MLSSLSSLSITNTIPKSWHSTSIKASPAQNKTEESLSITWIPYSNTLLTFLQWYYILSLKSSICPPPSLFFKLKENKLWYFFWMQNLDEESWKYCNYFSECAILCSLWKKWHFILCAQVFKRCYPLSSLNSNYRIKVLTYIVTNWKAEEKLSKNQQLIKMSWL